ncbi:protein ELYS-like [Tyto alba]|uniref:protein ELYS-like n=1 Tax=Tyto alba TaxID=56313 RepID=UPI001C670840|nr:protein ELYS-like [Tyto alba]
MSNVLSRIGAAWAGNEQKTISSRYDRLLGLVDRPVPSCSAAQGGSWQSPLLQKNSSRTPEFNLLQTPLVVKKAEVLATSASGFPGFTPRSILRSSVRSTPQATPSAFPGESVTPPPRANKHRVSFKEGNSDEKWTVGNDRHPRFREGACARKSELRPYRKILPRVQRQLAAERARPYHLPLSALRGGNF